MWSHRRQPTRLPRPWDSPGKNTRVGCHFLLQCVKVKSESEVAQSCLTLCDPMDHSLPGSSIHGIFPARVLEWGAIAFSGSYIAYSLKCSSLFLLLKFIILIFISCLCHTARGTLGPWPGLNPHPLHWKCGVLITGPPGKSLISSPFSS